MFDESVFNRIAFNLAELTKAVTELNNTMRKQAAPVTVDITKAPETSLDALLDTLKQLRKTDPAYTSPFQEPTWITTPGYPTPTKYPKPGVIYGFAADDRSPSI